MNIIDMDVSPGDYALVISQYSGIHNECGMYSLRGLLNLHSSMAQHLPSQGTMTKGVSNCELKNQEELPNRIYSSPAKTRRGNEATINEHG